MIPVGTMVELHGVDFLSEKKIQGSNMGSNRFRVDMPDLLSSTKRQTALGSDDFETHSTGRR